MWKVLPLETSVSLTRVGIMNNNIDTVTLTLSHGIRLYINNGMIIDLILVSTETPIQARVYQVKKADKGDVYKKKVTWLLRELKAVDGKSFNKVPGY